jgi:glycosyltransferase involved in cell wall biosynthesis
MRIAQVAPLYESIPPRLYGGTERVVSYLTEGLVELGHEVTLFATADSKTKANLIAPCEQALWQDENYREWLPYELRLMELVFKDLSRFEVIHFHTDYIQFPFLRRQPWANITTMHGRLHAPDLKPLFDEYADMPLVSISHDQRRYVPNADWKATVYHGLPRSLHRLHEGAGEYLAFLGRISPEKRLDRAVAIARQAGMKLKVAAKVYVQERDYYEREIARCSANPDRGSSSLAKSEAKRRTNFLATPTHSSSPLTGPSPSVLS